jgi:NifU-like protein involved in Fe-S cluster formation
MSLYTPQILALATDLAHYPLTADLPLRTSVRSRTCGSVITLGLACDQAGQVNRIGMQVSACAVGQASAAVLANALAGRSRTDIATIHARLTEWLAQDGEMPDWPQINLLAATLPHKGRHGALLLPWTAAVEALCSQAPSG